MLVCPSSHTLHAEALPNLAPPAAPSPSAALTSKCRRRGAKRLRLPLAVQNVLSFFSILSAWLYIRRVLRCFRSLPARACGSQVGGRRPDQACIGRGVSYTLGLNSSWQPVCQGIHADVLLFFPLAFFLSARTVPTSLSECRFSRYSDFALTVSSSTSVETVPNLFLSTTAHSNPPLCWYCRGAATSVAVRLEPVDHASCFFEGDRSQVSDR